MYKLLLFLIIIVEGSSSTEGGPRVNTILGTIEGFEKETASGKTFFAFEGVPYASPPVGKLRFKDPTPPKPWTGTWKANTMFRCMQYDYFIPPDQDMVTGDEDCLYLNIYSPMPLSNKTKADVLVYIHGGAFMFNHGGYYGPELILERDVVYVNLNYRLGPLGFLSTEDDVVPGNMGLKDQQLAFQWIKSNIEYFGGNPNSITISGMSAGGASVQFHTLVPKSKGLFHRGISMSGCTLNPWVLMEKALEKTKKVAALVGCPTENTKQIIECLRRKPGRQITATVQHFQPWLYNPFSPFAPVVDTWASKPFIPDHPYNLLKNKRVQDIPWIFSFVSAEGLYPGADFYPDEHLEYIDKNWNEIMPLILHYNDVVDPALMDDVSQKIRLEYLGNKKVSKETFLILIKILSDRLFNADIEKAGKLHSAAVKSPIYSYYFEYRGAHSQSEPMSKSVEDFGVCHSDDTSYVLHTHMDVLSTDGDRKMNQVMVDMFVSFMKTGKPNISSNWAPISKKIDDPWLQLSIKDSSTLILEENKNVGNRFFWDSLPIKENEKLVNLKDEL